MREKRIKAWHFLDSAKCLRFGDGRKVQAGRIYSYTGKEPPELCVRGVHASEFLLDALEYSPGPILCCVEVWGDVVKGHDKLVARHRKVLWMLDATAILHEFACRCAERALKIAKVDDKRSWDAIKTKRAWLAGAATNADLAAAWAGAAAWAAEAAAEAAAAAGAAERKRQERMFARMVMTEHKGER